MQGGVAGGGLETGHPCFTTAGLGWAGLGWAGWAWLGWLLAKVGPLLRPGH